MLLQDMVSFWNSGTFSNMIISGLCVTTYSMQNTQKTTLRICPLLSPSCRRMPNTRWTCHVQVARWHILDVSSLHINVHDDRLVVIGQELPNLGVVVRRERMQMRHTELLQDPDDAIQTREICSDHKLGRRRAINANRSLGHRAAPA